ncbi:MAG: C25 family cysteine peptidase, partial [Candidatus Cloacimonadaceae bacterium]|nr:C25 family cysteine peptidase [Candidatus Cloacimonadaceae bacterium]
QVSTAINNGRGFVNYCGHGNDTTWATSMFNNTNVNALSNGVFTPVIMDVACFNGNFSTTCFAEAWLRKSGGGAVNMYASSVGQAWAPPMRAQDEVTDLMVAGSKFTAGGLFYNGSCKMIDVYGADGEWMYKTWHIFGDASLLVRSKTPLTMTVTHPSSFSNGIGFTVSTGVANALVAVTKNGVIHARAYTNTSGNASLIINNGTSSETYTITVTAPNRVAYMATIICGFAGSVWNGQLSSNWSLANNWTPAGVPTTLTDVLIQSSTPFTVSTYAATAYCRNLYVGYGATLIVNTNHILVANDASITGTVAINSNAGDMFVTRDMYWQSGSSISSSLSGADLVCGRNMTFEDGSNVNFALGNLSFSGSVNASITNHSSATQINNLYNMVDISRNFSFSSASTQDILIKGSFLNGASQTSFNYYTGTVTIRGNLISENTGAGGLLWNYGTLVMDGSNQQISLPHADAYLNHLTLSQTGTLTLNSNLRIKGNLSFESGVFSPGSNTFTIGGNWTNPLGPTAFTEGSGRVIFNGTSHQYCYGSETFNILEVNKTSGALRINNAADNVICAMYDWTAGAVDVLSGTFTANDLIDEGIYGSWYVNPGGTINIKNYNGWVDLNGLINFNGGGTVNVFGGTSESYWPYSGNASLNMNGGVLDFKDQGIRLNNSATFTLTNNISGGTIKTSRSFMVYRTDFAPTGGILELYGSVDATLSLATGSTLHHLTINKSTSRDEAPIQQDDRMTDSIPVTRANSVSTSGNLVLNGNFLLQAGSFTAPTQLTVKGNWTNSVGATAFVEGSGRVIFAGSGNSTCYGEGFATLELNKTGTGKLIIPSGTTLCSSYDWTAGTVQVSGGVFMALDLADNNVKGGYTLSSGTIDLSQDASFFVDLDADLNISGGTMYVRGGMPNIASEWAYTRPVSVTMSGGILDFTGNGLRFSATAHTLTLNLSGGTIRTTGSVGIERPSMIMGGGTVELYGGADATISQIAGSLYNILVINKSTTRDSDRTRSNKVTAASHIMTLGGLSVSAGVFDPMGYTVYVGGDLNVSGRIEMSNSAAGIMVTGSTSWSSASSASITAGSVQVGQNWTIQSGSAMQFSGSGTAVFTGSQPSVINAYSGSAYFHHLNSNKSGSTLDMQSSSSSLTINGNLGILSGRTFRLIQGNVSIGGSYNLDGICIMSAGALSTGALALQGTLTVSGGTITVNGTISQGSGSILTLNGGNIYVDAAYTGAYYGFSGTVNLNSGTLRITNNGIQLGSGSNMNIAGGSLKLGWGFKAIHNGAFQPVQGTVEFIGSRTATIECTNG